MFTKFLYYFFSVIFLLAVAALSAHLLMPAEFEQFRWDMRRARHEILYGKDISYRGLSRLQSEDIEVRLPMDASVWWWNFNTAVIEAGLREHPLIQDAAIERCTQLSWRCFRVVIKERHPRYILEIGQYRWVIGEDGGFITTAPDSAALPNTTVIRGIGDLHSSPDLVRGRLDHLRRALQVLEGQVGAPAKSVDFAPNLEFTVLFDGVPFPVRLDLSNDGQLIPRQARRLKKLLEEFSGRLEAIERVDLAYEKVAVVQVQPAAGASSRSENKRTGPEPKKTH